MQYLKGKGIKTSENIAIVGFSDEPISSVIEPSLKTIDQPAFEIKKIAANLLLEQINNKPGTIVAETIVLKPVLIKRNSPKKKSE